MKYSIKKIVFGNNRVTYVPIFANKSLEILSEFLSSEVGNFKKHILDVIKMAQDSCDLVEFAGNVCLLQIENNKVFIECMIDDVEIGEPVEMELDEFAELVDSWIKDTKNANKT